MLQVRQQGQSNSISDDGREDSPLSLWPLFCMASGYGRFISYLQEIRRDPIIGFKFLIVAYRMGLQPAVIPSTLRLSPIRPISGKLPINMALQFAIVRKH